MSQLNSIKLILTKYFDYFSAKFLTLLLITDLAFILLHLLIYIPSSSYGSIFLSEVIWHKNDLLLTQDQGFAEVFQYIKEFWIALLLLFGYWQRRQSIFLAWALFYGYLLLDDFLSIHELIGINISNFFNFPDALSLRGSDFGELVFLALVGISFLLLISRSHAKSKSDDKKYSNLLVFFLLALAIPGILFDLIHVLVNQHSALFLIFVLLEDGGEHLILSFVLAFVYKINWQY